MFKNVKKKIGISCCILTGIIFLLAMEPAAKRQRVEEPEESSEQEVTTESRVPSLSTLAVKALVPQLVEGKLNLFAHFDPNQQKFEQAFLFASQTGMTGDLLNLTAEFKLLVEGLKNYIDSEAFEEKRIIMAKKIKESLEVDNDLDNAFQKVFGERIFAAGKSESARTELIQRILKAPINDDGDSLLHWAAERAFDLNTDASVYLMERLLRWYPHPFLLNKKHVTVIDTLLSNFAPAIERPDLEEVGIGLCEGDIRGFKQDYFNSRGQLDVPRVVHALQQAYFLDVKFLPLRNLLGLLSNKKMTIDNNLNWLMLCDATEKVRQALDAVNNNEVNFLKIGSVDGWNIHSIFHYYPLLVAFGACSAEALLKSSLATDVKWPKVFENIAEGPFMSPLDFFLKIVRVSGPGVRLALKRFIKSPVFNEIAGDEFINHLFSDTIALGSVQLFTVSYYLFKANRIDINKLRNEIIDPQLFPEYMTDCLQVTEEEMPTKLLWNCIQALKLNSEERQAIGITDITSYEEFQHKRFAAQAAKEMIESTQKEGSLEFPEEFSQTTGL